MVGTMFAESADSPESFALGLSLPPKCPPGWRSGRTATKAIGQRGGPRDAIDKCGAPVSGGSCGSSRTLGSAEHDLAFAHALASPGADGDASATAFAVPGDAVRAVAGLLDVLLVAPGVGRSVKVELLLMRIDSPLRDASDRLGFGA